jgi:formylglycine-generating enzyme required for sulfatase activity
VVVPAGEFIMGSPPDEEDRDGDEQPQHKVAFTQPFAVSKFEVTFDEWHACVAYGDCDPHVSDSGWGRGQRPVIDVSWDHAQRFAAWLSRMTSKSYRLLTEAEWEYAARAGTTTAYSWGDDIGMGNANCDGCGSRWDNRQTAPVGSFPANAFGLHDMLGNVSEWVEDCEHNNYIGAPADGSAWTAGGDCTRRGVRGGAWHDQPRQLRSASRSWSSTDYRHDHVGFRVARTLPDSSTSLPR